MTNHGMNYIVEDSEKMPDLLPELRVQWQLTEEPIPIDIEDLETDPVTLPDGFTDGGRDFVVYNRFMWMAKNPTPAKDEFFCPITNYCYKKDTRFELYKNKLTRTNSPQNLQSIMDVICPDVVDQVRGTLELVKGPDFEIPVTRFSTGKRDRRQVCSDTENFMERKKARIKDKARANKTEILKHILAKAYHEYLLNCKGVEYDPRRLLLLRLMIPLVEEDETKEI